MEVNFYTIFLDIKIKLTSNFREEEEIRRCNILVNARRRIPRGHLQEKIDAVQ
jgi:hypothetical protein